MRDPVFLFDVGSPNAYLAHRAIPAIEARSGLRFVYRPVLLGGLFKLTGNKPPMVAYADVPAKLRYEARERERFEARHGITKFRMNPHFPVNTLAMMRAAVAAEAEGLLGAYADAILAGMWEEGLKLDDPAVLADRIAAAGLPAERLLTLANDPAIKDRLVAYTQDAADKGAFGSPSFLVGDELYFGKDKLEEVEREALAL